METIEKVNVNKLKIELIDLSNVQRILKNQRKTKKLVGERLMEPWEATCKHEVNREKLRLMYAAYGLLRGKSFSQTENKHPEEGHPLYDQMTNDKIYKDLHSAHKILTKERHFEYSVHNICKALIQFAVQDYMLFGSINMMVINQRFKAWESTYWENMPKKYKDLLIDQYSQVKAQYLNQDFLIQKIQSLNRDPTRTLRIDNGGAYGSKARSN